MIIIIVIIIIIIGSLLTNYSQMQMYGFTRFKTISIIYNTFNRI